LILATQAVHLFGALVGIVMSLLIAFQLALGTGKNLQDANNRLFFFVGAILALPFGIYSLLRAIIG